MRFKHRSIRLKPENEVNILPLIDVLFAILIFFMLSSIVLTERNQITIKRPANSQPDQVSKTQRTITISLKKNKELYFEQDKIAASQLSRELKRSSKNSSIGQVLIDAEKTSTYSDVMEIIDIVKEAGVNSIGLAVNKRNINEK